MSASNSIYLSDTYKEVRTRYLLLILFFLIWPFGGFLYALYNYDKRESKAILVLFTAILAYSMIPVSASLDLYRVLYFFPEYSRLNYSDFVGRIKNLYSRPDESGSVDLYRDMVTFLVSRFTDNGHWLMFIFGLIAGYIYIKVISLFTFEQSGKNIYKYILIISFSFIIGLDQLSGVRFSLAAYVFFLGAIKVIIYGDKRFFVVAAMSVLIHFSFLSVVILLLIFFKAKYYPKIIYLLLILSFVLPDILHNYIIQYSGLFGGAIEARTQLYYGLVQDLNFGSDTVWYVRYRINIMNIFCYLILLISRLTKKKLNYSEKTNDLFLFSLIILSFVNFTMDIPHFGYRFQFVFIMFTFFYLYKVYAENSESSSLASNLVLFSLPFSSLMIAYSLRSILYLTPLTLYYFNLPGVFIYQPAQTVWTYF